MRVAIAGAPGQVIWAERDLPPLGPGEVLLEPLACGICTTDVKAVRRGAAGEKAHGLGHELVGRILSTGERSPWPLAQRVIAAPYVPCGQCRFCLSGQLTLCEHLFENSLDPGGLAERVRVPRAIAERGLFAVPDGLPSEVAALCEPVGCCVHAIEDCAVGAHDTVLIVGDGPMGLLNAAVARAYGAAQVLVAGLTPARLQLATHYADVAIHVGKEDLEARVRALTSGRGADVVLVAVSSPEAVANGLRSLRPGGVLNVFAGVPEGTMLPLDLRRLHYEQIRLTGSFGLAPGHLCRALDLLANGRIDVAPLITGRFPFSQVQAAVDYASQQAGMKAVVSFG